MTSPLPARVGRYEIVDRLGVGGMGVVYLATDPLLRRTVAIKILPGQDDELRERFAREARSAAALRHNNIVTIYDVGEDDGRPFIAMEFVDGESMAEMIRRRPPLPVQRRLQLVIDLCAGLGYAHRSGIIHRDIKPANLMITTEGSLKILDFGLARVTTDATSAGLTRVGSLMGTPHYMSPEQVEGMPADQASDIFSVGLVLYEILTFRKAFPGESAQAILLKIVQSEPTPVAELLPTIDAELERVVTRATVKDRAQRYPNLAALASALERVRTRLGADQPTAFQDAPAPAGDKPPKSGRGARSTDPSLRNIPNLDAIAERRRVQMEQHLRAATEAFEAGKYETAIEHCENAAVLNPQENKALELLQQAHRAIEDRQLRGWLDLAKQQLSKGALTEAEALIEQSLKLRSGSVDALALQRELKEKRRDREREAERSRAVRSAVERAKRNMEEGALEAAARCASEALAYDPEHEEAKALKAQALEILEERRRQREHEEAALDVVAKARDVARAENIHAAVKLLRQFDPPHPLVTEAIADFDAEIAYLEERRKEEEARLQREEEERRLREEEDRQRRDEEERRRLADQERQRRAEEERQRRAEDERQRRAEEERRRLQAAEEKRRRDQAAAFKAQARDAMNIGEFAQALAALQSARETLPGDDEIDGLVTSVEKARDAAEAAARVRRSVERSLVGARASLERDELEEALRLVASALKHSPDDSDALALQGEVRDAIAVRTRQDTERRAAEGAMASAVDMFQAGDIDGAIGALEAFAPSALVRAMLEELRGEKARREEEARVALEAKRRAEEEAIARAQEEREQREREARARAEEEERQRKEREAKAKAAEEERQRKEREAKAKAAEEERQRKEREAKARADEEARQRQEREAKAKAAEEERQRKEREARARAEEEARQRKEREAKAKAAEEERQRKEREAKARAEEEERQRKEREARAKAAEDERRRVEEEARRAAEARRKAEEAAALRAREARARELAETAVGPLVEPPAVELPSSSNIPTMVGLDRPDELPTTIEFPLDADVSEDIASGDVSGGALPFSKPVMAAIAASLALVLAVGGYLLTRAPAADAVATPTPIPGPAAPPAGGPTPAVDAKRLLQDARDLYLQRNSPSAIASALSVPENAPERAEAVALLEQIRGDAQALALADRRDAEDAGKTGEDVFKQAVGMSDQAQKLTGLADVPKAVSLYENSSALFRQVTSTGWSAARFVQQARTELRARRTPQAIDFALKGLGQEPGNRDALALLQSVRTNAANLADAAARQARTAGATEANSPFFKDARSKEDAARRLQTPRDTLAAINQYDAARAAYVNAVAEAKASDTLAAERNAQLLNGFLQRADERLKAGDLTGASTAIAEAAKLDADNPRVAELRRAADAAQTGQRAEQQRRIEIERALGEASKLTNDNEAIQSLRAALTRFPGNSEINDAIGRRTKARDDRIDDLVRRAKGAGDAQAITLLTEALGYNAGRTDISEEIERRRKSMGGGGNAAELRTRREGEVLRALNGYEAAYASRSVEDFLRVAPFRTRQQIENEFKSFRSIQLNVENASIALDDNGAGATVNCTISSVRVPAGVSAKPINDRRAWQLRLANVGGAWQITGATPAR